MRTTKKITQLISKAKKYPKKDHLLVSIVHKKVYIEDVIRNRIVVGRINGKY